MLQSSRNPLIRVMVSVCLIGLTLVMTLSPGPKGSMVDRMSVFLGGSDTSDANGHIILFCLLTASCFWAASARLAPQRALRAAAGIGLFLGTATEVLQHFVPERGTSLLDWGANSLGVILFALLYAFAKSRGRNETTTS